MRSKLINSLIIASVALLPVCAAFEYVIPEKELDCYIQRGAYGEDEKLISAVAEVEYDGEVIEKKVEFKIDAEELSQEEKLRRLDKCKAELPAIIISGNKDFNNITEDVDLITYHEETGVSIMWDTDKPELISKTGEVFPAKEKDNGYVLLTALLSIEGEETEFKCNMRHTLKLNKENYAKFAEKELDDMDGVLVKEDLDHVGLPDTLGAGINVVWKKQKEYKAVSILSVIAAVLIFVKTLEKSRLKNSLKRREEEILLDFPSFLDKLVMLLSAGLILKEAVERITEDYKTNIRPFGEKVLYEELCKAVDNINNSNSSFGEELTFLAERLEVREFARLAILLKDSINSGVELADKLESESIMIRYDRKIYVQKLGKTADSKLVFPLMLILIILIVIVMTPAVMQM